LSPRKPRLKGKREKSSVKGGKKEGKKKRGELKIRNEDNRFPSRPNLLDPPVASRGVDQKEQGRKRKGKKKKLFEGKKKGKKQENIR